jgi:hypothetical protein
MSKRHIIRLEHRPHRVYVFDRHLHHGLDGAILVAVGLFLILTDIRDFPWRFINDCDSYS